MKILLNTFILLFTFVIYENKVLALTDYQIREVCQKERKKLACIKNLKYQRYNLIKGNRVEIPVIPFKK